MHHGAWLASATPMPGESEMVDPLLVTPGPWGFAAIALVGIAAILLAIDMMRRVRRGRYRDEVREDLDAEERAEARAGAEEPGDAGEADARTDGLPPR